MSEFTAIQKVSVELKEWLSRHLPLPDPRPEDGHRVEDDTVNLDDVQISFESPRELRETRAGPVISLWLYRVAKDGFTLNRPRERAALAFNKFPRFPIPLTLCYLVTPLADSPEREQLMMGRILQTFSDHSIIPVPTIHGGFDSSTPEFRLSLETLSLEELMRVWDALQEPYQLSVSYQVQLVTIDSRHEADVHAPVVSKRTTYSQIVDPTRLPPGP